MSLFKYCASCCAAPDDFEPNRTERSSKAKTRKSRPESKVCNPVTGKVSLVLPERVRSKSHISRMSTLSTVEPIMEDRVLESLCQTTNIEVGRIKGSTVSVHERKKLFNKFQRHSETGEIFRSEHQLNRFMSDLYKKAPETTERDSVLSLNVPQRATLGPMQSNTSVRSFSQVSPSPSRISTNSRCSKMSRETRQSARKFSIVELAERGGRNVRRMLEKNDKIKQRTSAKHLHKSEKATINRPSKIVEYTRETQTTTDLSLTNLRI